VKLLFVAPRSVWRKALDIETRLALDDGHAVRVIAEDHPELVLDPRVEVRYIGANELHTPEPRLQRLLLRRLPLGGLRRIGRGPLRRPAQKVARRWKRIVVDPRDKDRRRATEALRVERRIERISAAVAEYDADWIVLHEPQAVELAVDWLPAVLDARPDLTTTFSYEPRAEAPHVI
jgi:hypothetical protein